MDANKENINMLEYVSVVILALFALLIVQTIVLVIIGRKILGNEDPAPLHQTVMSILSPDPSDPLPKVLKGYLDILTGSTLVAFIKTAKQLGSMSDDESDSLNAHLDLVIQVVNEFIKPVIVKQLTYESKDVEDYVLRATAVTDRIQKELAQGGEFTYYTERLITYNNRIGGDLAQIADIVITCTPDFLTSYIENEIKNRSLVHLDRIKHWRAR